MVTHTVLVGDDVDCVPSLSLALADPDIEEIVLTPGTYVEHVVVAPRRRPLLIRSETGRPDDVRVTFGLSQGDRDRTGMELVQDCATVTVDADDVTIRGIIIENSFDKRDWPGRGNTQALALRTRGSRVLVENCVLLGRQDTVLLDTPSFAAPALVHVRGCRIEGDVDFVYGRATAVLEDCVVHSVAPGYVAAPSTARECARGLLFLRCTLTAGPDVPAGSVHLGRPWHPGGKPDAIGQAWFVDCDLGPHVAAQAWTEMGGFAWQDARLGELGSRGPGAGDDQGARPQVPWRPTAAQWLLGWDGWPQPKGTLHLVGDSTTAGYDTAGVDRDGWGQRLDEATTRGVCNHAVRGTSSRSYIDLGLLDEVLNHLQPGDVLLIQFGDNEAKSDERDAEVFTQYAAQLRRYLVGARCRGAQPVLLTPVERRCFDMAGRARATHGGYPERVRDLARQEGVPLVDVTRSTRALWQLQGADGSSASFHSLPLGVGPRSEAGDQDETHLSASGARAVARIVVDGLVACGLLGADEVLPQGATGAGR